MQFLHVCSYFALSLALSVALSLAVSLAPGPQELLEVGADVLWGGSGVTSGRSSGVTSGRGSGVTSGSSSSAAMPVGFGGVSLGWVGGLRAPKGGRI